MIKNFILLFLLLAGCNNPAFSQTDVTTDVLPNTNSADSTAVLNNDLRRQQNAINSIGGYFNSNNALSPANGGTGTNISNFPNGSLLIYDAGNIGIGTFGQGNSGDTIVSNGPGMPPTWTSSLNHGIQIFTSSGTFVAPAVTNVYLTECGGGGGGTAGGGSGNGGGGGGGGACLSGLIYPVVSGNSYTITIGAGGTPASGTTSAAGNGGATTFDLISVNGGIGGNNINGGAGGASASLAAPTDGVGGGPYGISGGNGHTRGTNNNQGGGGGGSLEGIGGAGNAAASPGNGSDGSGYGSGGGGGYPSASGGNGAPGVVVIQY